MNFATATRPLKVPNRTISSKEAQESRKMYLISSQKDTMAEEFATTPICFLEALFSRASRSSNVINMADNEKIIMCLFGQVVRHLTRNEAIVGSTPTGGM
jgi:hypothetical protein